MLYVFLVLIAWSLHWWAAAALVIAIAAGLVIAWVAPHWRGNPVGNADEPLSPAWHLPTWPRPVAWLVWMLWRNALHNFSHYQVGLKGQDFELVHHWAGDGDRDGFADRGGWLLVELRRRNRANRYFVSYAGRVHCYLGWHPASGKFGFRLTR